MRKYITVLLCCFLMAVFLIPGTYSLWRKDLNIMGNVEISAEKKGKGYGHEQGYGNELSESESFTGQADSDVVEGLNVTQEVGGAEYADSSGDIDRAEGEDKGGEKRKPKKLQKKRKIMKLQMKPIRKGSIKR